jgi:hypothetical protein
MAIDNDITPAETLYAIFVSAAGARCVREHEGTRYVLVRMLPPYPVRMGWVRERDLGRQLQYRERRGTLPVIIPPVRGARVVARG